MTSTERLIMHVDMDAFFASVEQRDNPEYRGRPLVVGALPGNRGVVATCSYEARAFGIHSAMPISEAYRRCPDAVYLRPRMACYAEASKAVMSALGNISPVIQKISIDEAYLDITGLDKLFGTATDIGRLAQQEIQQSVDLGCSVGIGPNRLIAKLASEYKKPMGLTVVPFSAVQAFLDPMPVSNLRGVGRQMLKRVNRLGIKNIAQLKQYSLALLKENFGQKAGHSLYQQARGLASAVVECGAGRKSISKETTFGQDVTSVTRLKDTLRLLASEVGRTARHEGLKGRVVTMKIRLTNFETYTRQCQLAEPENMDGVIFKKAWQLYLDSGFKGKSVRLIGLGLSAWDEASPIMDLFDTPEKREKDNLLYKTLDQVNDKFGNRKIAFGLEKKT